MTVAPGNYAVVHNEFDERAGRALRELRKVLGALAHVVRFSLQGLVGHRRATK